MFDFVIAVDWSAEQGRKPNPQENRCWIAWGTPNHRSEPEYMPTRVEALARIESVITDNPGRRTLVGLDFAIGYPTTETGDPVLPTGRELCALMNDLVTDDPAGNNNRFHAAAELNRRIKQITGAPDGPFWGRPRTLPINDLTEKRPEHTRTNKLRAAEIAARKQSNSKPKSAWQLAGAGSVGGQSLVGLKAVHQLLESLGSRAHLWPFDPAPNAPNAVTIAEIYPSLYVEKSPAYWYKDARQVVDTRDAILDDPHQPQLLEAPDVARLEGWIFGVKPISDDPARPSVDITGNTLM